MEVVSRDEVLDIVRKKGPLLPREVVKDLGKSDTLMVGAVLSQLVNSNHVKVTNTKIGASPTYYCPGQENNLTSLSKYLNEKDKRAYDLIESKKIIRDSKQEPLMRVSLRAIKDFAKPLEINVNDQKEIFWKWYLLSNEEAIKKIKEFFAPKIETKPEIKEETKLEPTQELKEETKLEEILIVNPVLIETKPQIEEKIIEVKEPASINKVQVQSKLIIDDSTNTVITNKTIIEETQTNIILETEFLTTIRQYFKNNNILIDVEEQIKKDSEYDFLIKIPTPFGRINFFCKAKSKKKNNETDVAAAYLAADKYRLPTIFLTTGEFTKKAEKELEKFKNITIKSI